MSNHTIDSSAPHFAVDTTVDDVLCAGEALNMLRTQGEEESDTTVSNKKKRSPDIYVHMDSNFIPGLKRSVVLLFDDIYSPAFHGHQCEEKRRNLVTTVLKSYGIPEDYKMKWTEKWEANKMRNKRLPTTVHEMTLEAFNIVLDLINKEDVRDFDLFNGELKQKIKNDLRNGKSVLSPDSWADKFFLSVVPLFAFKILLGYEVDPTDDKPKLLDFITHGLDDPEHEYHKIGIPLLKFLCEYTSKGRNLSRIDELLQMDLRNFSRNAVAKVKKVGVWNREFFEPFVKHGEQVFRPDGKLATPNGIFFYHALILVKLVPLFYKNFRSVVTTKVCLGGERFKQEALILHFFDRRWYTNY